MSQLSRAPRATAARIPRSGEILDLVRRGEASTTGQLADALGIARSTVNDRVDVLVASGMLASTEASNPNPGNGPRGRPAASLSFNARSGTALAAQLGISGIRLAITDLAGTILWSEVVDIDLTQGPDVTLQRATATFDRALDDLGESRDRVHGIGFGTPGRAELQVHARTSAHRRAAADWTDDHIRTSLQEWLPVPIFVDHDVNLLAFGEHCARPTTTSVLLCVKVGTVIGCGIVIDGRVVQGSSRMAGEIGHTRVAGSEVPCSCGKLGCLNAVASGGALARRLQADGLDTPNARAVAALARSGHVEAGHAVRMAGRDIGEVLAAAVNLLNPGVVSLWGYLAEAEDHLAAGIHESIARSSYPGPARAVTIETASMGLDAGIYGAAMIVIEHALRPASVDAHLLATMT